MRRPYSRTAPSRLAIFVLLTTASAKVRVGILGLPNVGKSTLFNALARKSLAQAENFPFCTIDPNTAPIAVPDLHLESLGKFAGSERTVPAFMIWIDIAGLAKGASRGEGLGNKFLATARECDCIVHLVRAFEDPSTIHVEGKVDAAADAEVINLELVLADAEHVSRRLEKTSCQGEERAALEAVAMGLSAGVPARSIGLSEAAKRSIRSMGLLTLKPVLHAFNVDEVDLFFDRAAAKARAAAVVGSLQHNDPDRDLYALVSAKLEADISRGSRAEQRDYLASLGLEEAEGATALHDLLSYRSLPLMIQRLLGLSLAYTGPGVPPERSRTTRAHLFRQGALTAAGLAGRIHGDIERGFVHAEVAPARALLEHASYADAKSSGCIRTEGREAVLSDEDVVLIKWSS